MEPASLNGLPIAMTYPKTYRLLKAHLAKEQCKDIYDMQTEAHTDHQTKLESVLASLSDAQFEKLAKILACSPKPRHRMYISICAMLFPQDLATLQDLQAYHHSGASNLAPAELSPLAFQAAPSPTASTTKLHENQQAQPKSWNSICITFSTDDVDGAGDLLLKTALHMHRLGLDLRSTNILLLQRFASLSNVISHQLLRKWESKWPLDWQAIDEFTLDLRRAYAPDGVYLPREEWLHDLSRHGRFAPTVFRVLAPTEDLEMEAYNAFGIPIPCRAIFENRSHVS